MVVHAHQPSRRRHPRRCGLVYAACGVRSPVPSIRQTASGEFKTPTAKGVKPTGSPIQQTRSDESGSIKPGRSIIGNLQTFLLELGKGFAFVARQKRIELQSRPRCMKNIP